MWFIHPTPANAAALSPAPAGDTPIGLGAVEAASNTVAVITVTNALAAGSMVFVYGHSSGNGTLTVTDSRSNTYTTGTAQNANGRANRARSAITTGLEVGDSITLTWTVSGNIEAAAIGFPGSDGIDGGSQATGTTGDPSVGHTPATSPVWIAVGGYFNGDGLTITAEAGWDLRQIQGSGANNAIKIWTRNYPSGGAYTFAPTGHTSPNVWALHSIGITDEVA